MITYVNSSNSSKYSVLFEDAMQELVKAEIEAGLDNGTYIGYETEANGDPKKVDGLYVPKDQITTIEKYFSYLPKLVQLGGATSSNPYDVLHSSGRRYTMLPVDEDVLVIDANTREIDIKSTIFSKNGIAVQGDELSEILYFKVDRFFDAMDLDTADIYIQWTKPNGDTGVSLPWVVDIESEPNKIIFGWALSSTITELPGTLKFAVRFYQWADKDTGKLAYSWSTQTATATIKPALDFKLGGGEYLPELDTDDTIVNRIQNSTSKVVGNADAKLPIYIVNLRDDENAVRDADFDDAKTKIVYIDLVPVTDSEGTVSEVYTLKTEAASVDSGIVSYEWYKLDQTIALGADGDATGSSVEFKFIPTEDEEVDARKVYYFEESAGVFKKYEVSKLGDKTPKQQGLLEKFSTCTINQVGSYKAVATNRLAARNVAILDSDTCVVPMPSPANIDTPLNDHEIVATAEDAEAVTLSVVCSNKEANNTTSGTLTYKWFIKHHPTDAPIEIFAPATASSIEVKHGVALEGVEVDERGDHEKIENIEGYYFVIVNNHKNGEDVAVTSSECRVSFAATAPELAFPVTDAQVKIDFSKIPDDATKSTVKVLVKESWVETDNMSDDITYQWYQTDDDVVDIELDDENENGIPGEYLDAPLQGETHSYFKPATPGKYFCVITNHKNHTTADTASKVFFVV